MIYRGVSSLLVLWWLLLFLRSGRYGMTFIVRLVSICSSQSWRSFANIWETAISAVFRTGLTTLGKDERRIWSPLLRVLALRCLWLSTYFLEIWILWFVCVAYRIRIDFDWSHSVNTDTTHELCGIIRIRWSTLHKRIWLSELSHLSHNFVIPTTSWFVKITYSWLVCPLNIVKIRSLLDLIQWVLVLDFHLFFISLFVLVQCTIFS